MGRFGRQAHPCPPWGDPFAGPGNPVWLPLLESFSHAFRLLLSRPGVCDRDIATFLPYSPVLHVSRTPHENSPGPHTPPSVVCHSAYLHVFHSNAGSVLFLPESLPPSISPFGTLGGYIPSHRKPPTVECHGGYQHTAPDRAHSGLGLQTSPPSLASVPTHTVL